MDGTIRMWDLDTGLPIGQPIEHEGGDANDLSVERDGPLLAISGPDGDAWLYNFLDLPTACMIIDDVVAREQPDYLGEGGVLEACESP